MMRASTRRRRRAWILTAALLVPIADTGAQAVLEFTAMDYAFRAPATVAAGLTTIRLRNTGTKLHHVQLFRLNDGKRLADLFPLLYRAGSIRGAPAWAVPAGGPSAALPGRSIAVRQPLAPGRYAAICWIPAPDGQLHFMKGMMVEFEVTGSSAPTAEPRAAVRVSLREYEARLSQPLTRGPQTLRVENVGRQAHEFLLVRLADGKSVEDVEAWSGRGQPGAAPVEDWVGMAGIAPGGVAFLDVTLTPGRYALFCLSPDEGDGRAHLHHGFRSVITVR